MKKKHTMRKEDKYLAALKRELKVKFKRGGKGATKGDYETLSDNITSKLQERADKEMLSKDRKKKERIGEEVLMRLWGYVKKGEEISITSLGKLARSLDSKYTNWQDFCDAVDASKLVPTSILPESIDIETIRKGFKFILGWYPEKYCTLEYLGEFEFRVLESKGLKKQRGETFFSSLGFKLSLNNDENGYPAILIEDEYLDYEIDDIKFEEIEL